MAKKGGKRSAKKKTGTSPTVTVRFANPGRRSMAHKKKGSHKKKGAPRHNPANPKKGRHHRRRRNPETFAQRAGKLAFGSVVAVATGVGVVFAAGKIMPGSDVSLYGVPALTFLAGVGIARTMPTLGVGMALGAFAPFIVPLTSKLLTATAPPTPHSTTAAMRAVSMARAYRRMSAVHMGGGRMGAIDQHAYA